MENEWLDEATGKPHKVYLSATKLEEGICRYEFVFRRSEMPGETENLFKIAQEELNRLADGVLNGK